jgi:hypothetical protein
VLAIMGSELEGSAALVSKAPSKKAPSSMVCNSGVSLHGWLAVAACSGGEQ